ncbi:hypothetical protein NEMBOFW57_006527 [Staphylotrichum longicolle]|uniref:Uncharacterized protein n=1 Tax=Staphylotrichum longicolle TaxID=669026 RepID=A0AAD4HWL3_9PEZI|nr:hypothetical protein NEMBOFW57_006527 [Staphylotrichum longicolle]
MATFAFERSNPAELPPFANEVLEGPPPTTWRDLKRPKLRRFPRHGEDITWLDYLGHGIAGLVFKVTIGGGDPVALKIFWRTRRPRPRLLPTGKGYTQDEWPLEDESHNVALLEKLEYLINNPDDERPLPILRRPKTLADVVANLRGFSDEVRDSPVIPPLPEDPIRMPDFPPLPACYGWTTVHRDEIPHLVPAASDHVDGELGWHWAIVYELVPGAPQDLAVGQAHLDFFYAMGFAMQGYNPDNWRGGRLIDMNDLSASFSTGWRRPSIIPRDAKEWFWTLDFENAPKQKRRLIQRSFKRKVVSKEEENGAFFDDAKRGTGNNQGLSLDG